MSASPYAGQTVLITGASKGIGAYLVEYYQARGAWVAGCARSIEPGETENGWSCRVDVTDEKAVSRWIREAHRRRGQIDVLINNAGAASMNHSLLTPSSAIRDAVELNCIAGFVAGRQAVKLMKRRKYGRIVNLTTIAVPMLLEGELSYAASKAALETMTRIMAAEVAPFGVTVNMVGPCPVATDLIRGVPQDKMDALVARLPLGTMATVEDVAYAVDMFSRPEARHLTAQTLYLGGVS